MTTATTTVVYIVSCPFSGSTWLNLLLASHSRAFGVGELDKFQRDFGRVPCRVHGSDCPFWNRFDPKSPEDKYVQIARLCGKEFIVNNNKSILTIGDHCGPSVGGKYIFLHRDGRAVVASRMRKRKEKSIQNSCRWWVKTFHNKWEGCYLRFPREDRLDVSYEVLVDHTEREVRRICDFLGWEFEPQMLEYWNFEHHLMGGNVGTQYTLARLKNKEDLPSESVEHAKESKYNWDVSYYKQSNVRNFRDERWRKELGPWKRFVFWWIAGPLNRRLGYHRNQPQRPT